MNILVLTRYTKLGASSRYRFFQFIPLLEKSGWKITQHSLLGDDYIKYLYEGKSFPFISIIKSYLKRIKLLLSKKKYDLIWLQQEAFPWLPFLIEKLFLHSKVPIVVDYDDAFFHRYDLHKNLFVRLFLKNKIDNVMKMASCVVVCNDYLSGRAKSNFAKEIKIFPTVIDFSLYTYHKEFRKDKFTIGWVGSPHTAKYLLLIKDALKEISKDEFVSIAVLGSGEIKIDDIKINIIPWDEETEIENIRTFDVGIMPLDNSQWERGKCGFKLIQYMACGIPVIASPVEINKIIVQHEKNGYLAETINEWIKYFRLLKNDIELRTKLGNYGRVVVEKEYSLDKIFPRLNELFHQITLK